MEYFLVKYLHFYVSIDFVYFHYNLFHQCSDVVPLVFSGTELLHTMNLNSYTANLFIKKRKWNIKIIVCIFLL